ncbi:MAG TPA: YihY/virulence factor BrkB family protein [Thermodesulfobacteriota bacterium]|nr:YihY/virulence factor BrkB family protein [Thermodesulfobacteriota bacterium]
MGITSYLANTRFFTYLNRDIWHIRLKDLPRRKYVWMRTLRIIVLAFRDFQKDNCALRASALTFYSLLSVIPVAALAFGIAKGFGLRENLTVSLLQRLKGQEDVAHYIIRFADALLSDTKGSIVAGVGVLVLLLTVIRLLNGIEDAFNNIWELRQGRTIFRKVADYLAIILIAPILFILSSSLTVYVTSQLEAVAQRIALLGKFHFLILFLIGLSPYIFLWVLLMFIYLVMPNTSVSLRGAALAGIIAGTLFQVVQTAYISFQIGVAKYNAVYGSFAALPLFMVWLQLSWFIVLLGAEISYAYDTVEEHEYESESRKASNYFKRILALRVASLCVKTFFHGKRPLDGISISHSLEAPRRLVQQVLDELVAAQVLNQVIEDDSQRCCYQPASSVDSLTIKEVLDRLDRQGSEDIPLAEGQDHAKLVEKLEALDVRVRTAPENMLLKDL